MTRNQYLGMLLVVVLIVNGIVTTHFLSSQVQQSIVDAGNYPPGVVVSAMRETESLEVTTGRACTSPERTVRWPLKGAIKSHTSHLTCGLADPDSPLALFILSHIQKTQLVAQQCRDLVVYGVAFGRRHVDLLSTIHTKRHLNSEALLKQHGPCFFMFVLEHDMPSPTTNTDTYTNNSGSTTMMRLGHTQLIPIPRHVLPYQNMRRNTKLLKYHGHFIFPDAQRIVWQDAKFFKEVNIRKQPTNYLSYNKNDNDDGACVTAMSLPVHANTFGSHRIKSTLSEVGEAVAYQPQYIHHCETILESLVKRPDVTDSADTMMQQCNSYLLQTQQENSRTGADDRLTMDQGLLDSAFVVWNYSTKQCRDFNAELQCTLSDQLQCYSDRDQVSFPFAMAHMELRVKKQDAGEQEPVLLDQRQRDVQLVRGADDDSVMVHMTKSACHWYYRSLGDCNGNNRSSIAVLVAGSTKRLHFESAVRNLLQPLTKQDYSVDFHASLTTAQGKAYRSDNEYMNHMVEESLFRPTGKRKQINADAAFRGMREAVEDAGASARRIYIRTHPLRVNAIELDEKRQAARLRFPEEDADLRFPMLDMRGKAVGRTAVGNRNILRLFYGLQHLWDTSLVPFENSIGKQYDYIMILRDDALWLEEFDIAKLLAVNPTADAFVLSCDAREPKMAAQEINDHGIVIKREKAQVVGRYLASMLDADLEECHKQAQDAGGGKRGCNSEMILKWILQHNDITVQGVPQSVLPFERTLAVREEDGSETQCFHKFCQSQDAPLAIPDGMCMCTSLNFTTAKPITVDKPKKRTKKKGVIAKEKNVTPKGKKKHGQN